MRPDFALVAENAAVVAAICRRLDGLPLAIELAAARVNVLPLPALLKWLEPRLPLLTGGGRDLPARQRTMRDAIAWSYELLSHEGQALFRRLAVFVGGCSIEAAEAVGATTDESGIGVLDALSALVNASLLRREAGPDGAGVFSPRFGMLETIREYGLEQLTASGEAAAIQRRHTAWYLALAERAAPELYGGPNQLPWLNRLEAEHDNLRSALRWALASHPATALRLGGSLFWFWYVRGHLSEGRRWLEQALARGSDAPPAVRGRALLGTGMLAHWQDADSVATPLLEEIGFVKEQGRQFDGMMVESRP